MSEVPLAEILANFHLVGEDVVHTSSGRILGRIPRKGGYRQVMLRREDGTKVILLYHRIKFALLHGYLPVTVDHVDRDTLNNRAGNLRAADRSLQIHNTARSAKRALPRGVLFLKRLRQRPYKAKVSHRKETHNLGYFATPEEASHVVEEFLRRQYGTAYSKA